MTKPGGYLYAIGAAGTGSVKIGSTRKSAHQRLKELQTGHPLSLQVLAEVAVESNLSRIEHQIHAFLAAQRQQGEWFELPMDESQLAALVARAIAYITQEEEEEEQKRQRQLRLPPQNPAAQLRQDIGRRILLRRRELALTQKELAARCGFPYQVICGVERGRQSLYMERLAVLAQALRISADWLLGLGEALPGHLAYERGPVPGDVP